MVNSKQDLDAVNAQKRFVADFAAHTRRSRSPATWFSWVKKTKTQKGKITFLTSTQKALKMLLATYQTFLFENHFCSSVRYL